MANGKADKKSKLLRLPKSLLQASFNTISEKLYIYTEKDIEIVW